MCAVKAVLLIVPVSIYAQAVCAPAGSARASVPTPADAPAIAAAVAVSFLNDVLKFVPLCWHFIEMTQSRVAKSVSSPSSSLYCSTNRSRSTRKLVARSSQNGRPHST